MASTFQQLVDGLREYIDEPRLTFDVGERARSKNDSPPRVVWVATGGQILPATLNGRMQLSIDGVPVACFPAYDDVITVEAHIWAESAERFERIQQKLLSGCRMLFGTASQPGAYVIDTESGRSGNVHGDFTKGVQLFTWRTTVAHTRRQQIGAAETREVGPKMPAQQLVTILGQACVCSIDVNL